MSNYLIDFNDVPKSQMDMLILRIKVFYSVTAAFFSAGLLICCLGVYQYVKYNNYKIPELGVFLASLDSQYLADLQPKVFEVDLEKFKTEKRLFRPQDFEANIQNSGPYIEVLRKIEACTEFETRTNSDPQELKLKKWFGHACEGKSLSDDLWQSEPLNHPLSGSWAYWIWKTKKLPQDWIDEKKDYLHVLEYSSLSPDRLSSDEKVIAQMDLLTWSQISLRSISVKSEDYLYSPVDINQSKMTYNRYPYKKVESQISGAPFILSKDLGSNCLMRVGDSCWTKNPLYQQQSYVRWLFLAGLGLIVSIFSVIYFTIRLRKEYDSQRALMVHTLAHELRHPATSINLSLEFFRDQIDSFNTDLQVEVLRMIDEVKRLKLLVRASEQYLVTDSNKKMQLKPTKIKSINAYLNRIATSYDIDYVPLGKDDSFLCDAYWLGVCIENLIKNGLRHGQKPVTLKASLQDKKLKISVIDSGPGISGDYRTKLDAFSKDQNSVGIGLGLSITSKIAELMNADLTYSKKPSTFTINIPQEESIDAQDPAA